MSKRIERVDLSVPDPFKDVRESERLTRIEAELLLKELQAVADAIGAIKKEASGIKGSLLSTDTASVAGIEKKVKLNREANGLLSDEQRLQKEKVRIENELKKVNNDSIKQENDRIRLLQQRATLEDRAEKRRQKEIADQEKLNSVYSRVQAKLTKLTQEYRNLAIRKELGNSLTDKETKRYEFLQTRITKYDGALKAVDASMGRHQRNVGNYSSAFNGLGMSFQQLVREAPSLAVSFQTFALALSNNLPIFFDEIQKTIAINKELAASGKQTMSVFGQLGKSLFSLTGILGITVTAFTLLAPMLADFFSGSEKTTKQLKEEAKQQEALNKKRREGSEFIGQQSSQLVGLLVALRNTNAGSEERLDLMKKVDDQYNLHLKNLGDEAAFQRQVNAAIFEYISYQREAYRVKKNTELIDKNLANQDMIYKTINKELGLTVKELDRIALKPRAFGLIATELQQGIDPVNTLSRELGISVKRAEQLVTQFRQLQRNDREAVSTNTKNREEREGFIEATKELIGVTEELQDLDEARSKSVVKGLFQLDAANVRLNQYGINIADATAKMDPWEERTLKATKATKELTTALKAYDDELERRLNFGERERRLNQDMLEIMQNDRISVVSRLVQQELQNQMDFAEKSGEIFVDTLEKLVEEQFQLQKEAAIQRAEFERAELLKRVDAERVLEFERLTKERDELLKQEGLTSEQRGKIQQSYQDLLSELGGRMLDEERIVALEREKIALELQSRLGELDQERLDRLKEVNDELIAAQEDFAKKVSKDGDDKRKKDLDAEKKHQKEMADLRKKTINDILDEELKASKRREELADKDIAANQKLADQIRASSDAGNADAKKSIAAAEQEINQANARKAQEQAKQQRIEREKIFYQAIENYLQKGDDLPAATAKSITGIAVVDSVLNNLMSKIPKFRDGSRDTGSGGSVDQYGGFLSVLHPHERVVDSPENARLLAAGNPSNRDLVDGYLRAQRIDMTGATRAVAPHAVSGDRGSEAYIRPLLKGIEQLNDTLSNVEINTIDAVVRDGMIKSVLHTQKKGSLELFNTYVK
jgi:hypothetical protein